MPTKKIADLPAPCRDPDHNPPSHMVWANGTYEHVCSGCGRKTSFTVAKPTL